MQASGSLSVLPLSEMRFQAMSSEWQSCVSLSDANPLFMSWPWLFSWWETWSQVLGLELMLLGVYDDQKKLVGIGPFYRRDFVTPFGLRVKRLHLMGNAWRFASTVRTEYCGLIVDRTRAAEITTALMNAISEWQWDEWVICDVVDYERSVLKQNAGVLEGRISEVLRLKDRGSRINTLTKFETWLASLGKNTRLKAYNRRKYLQQRGKLEFSQFDPAVDGNFLDRLNQFHMERWAKPAFDAEALRFHRRLMARIPEFAGQVHCSALRFDGRCISVLYDVSLGGQRFNLQSGYAEDFDRHVSLGSLHLGYAIEESFSDPDTSHYDLLAGGGKNQYYKHHLKGETVQFRTLQLVRGRSLRLLYRGQSCLPDGWRRGINRWFRL